MRKLEAAGMDSRQAEAVAEAVGDAMLEMVATKYDLAGLGADLRSETRTLRGELRETELRLQKEIKALEVRLTTRMGTMMAGSAAVVIAVLGTLISLHH